MRASVARARARRRAARAGAARSRAADARRAATPPVVTASPSGGSPTRRRCRARPSCCGSRPTRRVKPIVANKTIEEVRYPHCSASALPFEPLSAEQLAHVAQSELEAHLRLVYQSLAGHADVNAKMNLLAYLHPLAHTASIANVIINSSFLALLLKMIRRFKSSTLRAVIVTLLGLLVRHATLIVPDEGGEKNGVLAVLVELTSDDAVALRRRAVACVGELLFYIATQEDAADDAPAGEPAGWPTPTAAAAAVVACLTDRDDDAIVQHYAAKTVENTLSQPASAVRAEFSANDVGRKLVSLFARAPEHSTLRTTVAMALAHHVGHGRDAAARASATLADVLAQSGGDALSGGVSDGAPRLQQALLNLLNVALTSPDARTLRALVPMRARLVPALLLAVEQGKTDAVKAKAALALALHGRADAAVLGHALERRLLVQLTRLANQPAALRERAYLYQCVLTLLSDALRRRGLGDRARLALKLSTRGRRGRARGGGRGAAGARARGDEPAPAAARHHAARHVRPERLPRGARGREVAPREGPTRRRATRSSPRPRASRSNSRRCCSLTCPSSRATFCRASACCSAAARATAHVGRLDAASDPARDDGRAHAPRRRAERDRARAACCLFAPTLLGDHDPIPHYTVNLLVELEAADRASARLRRHARSTPRPCARALRGGPAGPRGLRQSHCVKGLCVMK